MIDSPSAAEPPPSRRSNDGPPLPGQPTPPPQQAVRVPLPRSAPSVTYVIIAITIGFFVVQMLSPYLWGYPLTFTNNMDWLEYYGARINEFIRAGQIWRLLTPALLHGNLPHIFFNMYALLSLGASLERYFGHRRFLLLYILGAFAGNVASFLFTDGFSVGASTAVFGLIGAQGVFLYQNRKLFGSEASRALGNVIFVLVINLFIIGSLPFIDNWGHIGGLVGGLMFTSLAGPVWQVQANMFGYSFVDRRPARDVIVGTAVVLIIFGALALWGMVR